MIRKFLRVLRSYELELHRERWERDIGDALFATLRRERVLYDGGVADWYECGGRCGERRRVIEAPDEHPGKPYLALCAVDGGCLDKPLSEDGAHVWGFSFADAIAVLRRTLGIDGASETEEVVHGVFAIGSVDRSGIRADVFLAVNPDDDAFPHFVSARAHAQRAAVVLINTARWLPQAFVDAHGPGKRVEIALLEDMLAVRDGAIVATDTGERLRGRPKTSGVPVCLVIDADGERALDEAEYRELLGRAEHDLDFFLDVSTLHRDGRRKFFVGGIRHRPESGGARGVFERVELRQTEGAAAVEFIERTHRGRHVKPSELTTLADYEDALQVFRRAFEKLDPEPRQYVEQQPGSRDVHIAFAFRPSLGSRWAIVKRRA
jgi:hypothetical protein